MSAREEAAMERSRREERRRWKLDGDDVGVIWGNCSASSYAPANACMWMGIAVGRSLRRDPHFGSNASARRIAAREIPDVQARFISQEINSAQWDEWRNQ